MELISLIGGGFTGFLFRYLAEKRNAENENFNRLISLLEERKKSHDSAAERVPIDVGKITRRMIVICVLFASVLAPFIAPLFGLRTFVETTEKVPETFLGLIPAFTRQVFVQMNGFVYTQEMQQTLMAIVGFYFGSASAANKS